MERRNVTMLAVTLLLIVTACGSDAGDGDAASTVATTAAAAEPAPASATSDVGTTELPETTAATETTEPSITTEADASSRTDGSTTSTGGLSTDPDAEAASLAWTTAFDSSVGFAAKAELIEDAEGLRPTIEAYGPAGEAVGGITLVPTAVVVSVDIATITYDVEFAGQPAYQGQQGTIERVDGAWQVSREEFCGFMGAARNPCPA